MLQVAPLGGAANANSVALRRAPPRRTLVGRAAMSRDLHTAEDYKILEKVGEGSFGTVFHALDRKTGKEVALKKIRVRDVRVLPINALRELNSLRLLHHPNVIGLLGTHTHGSNLVLVLPFVPCSLGALLSRRDAPLPESHASSLARMLLQGLSAIHAEGLLHRDIKPNNLLIASSGELR